MNKMALSSSTNISAERVKMQKFIDDVRNGKHNMPMVDSHCVLTEKQKMQKFIDDVRNGEYDMPQKMSNSVATYSSSGRRLKAPEYFRDQIFRKGSGVAPRDGYEETDMTFNGY